MQTSVLSRNNVARNNTFAAHALMLAKARRHETNNDSSLQYRFNQLYFQGCLAELHDSPSAKNELCMAVHHNMAITFLDSEDDNNAEIAKSIYNNPTNIPSSEMQLKLQQLSTITHLTLFDYASEHDGHYSDDNSNDSFSMDNSDG